MANFDISIIKVLKNEDSTLSGKVTTDTGGLTKYGISQNAYPHENIRALTLDRAKTLYKKDYWDRLHLDVVKHQGLATKLLDIAVNAGVSRAVKWIQEVVGVEVDGILGMGTLNAINKEEGDELLVLLRNRQRAFYTKLAQKPKYAIYLKGWLRRVESC